MAKYKRPFIKGTNWAVAGLLGLFGFSSCEQAVEYGSPHADYVVKGKVIDKTTSEALPDLQVMVQYDAYTDYQYVNETGITATDGTFEIKTDSHEMPAEVRVITTDTKKDLFKPDTSFVSFENADFKGQKGWYKGVAEKEITIRMIKKNQE